MMRRNLGIEAVDLRYWDGQVKSQVAPTEELAARWQVAREKHKEIARVRRDETMTKQRGQP
jgi:hypothetical protein